MNKWWEISIDKLVSILNGSSEEEKLGRAFDIKYGHYEYDNDLRILCDIELGKLIENLLKDYDIHSNILICGANNGCEVKYLGGNNVTALDISPTALNVLRNKYPYVKTVQGNMNKLPFSDEYFDIYINLRSIQSRGVNIKSSIEESYRIIKRGGLMLFSIPNGYLDENTTLKGMWEARIQDFDTKLPYKLITSIEKELRTLHVKDIKVEEILSEIFIYGKK